MAGTATTFTVLELIVMTKLKLGIINGVKVTELQEGKLKSEGVKPGFVITQVNNKPVNSVEELEKIFKTLKGGVYIEGVYQKGVVAYYAFGL